jgi:hypothetical protein
MKKTPYTEIGIRRLKCFRCNNKAEYQWQICADNRIYRPLCKQCDIEMNRMVLEFMKYPNWEEKFELYKKQKNQ